LSPLVTAAALGRRFRTPAGEVIALEDISVCLPAGSLVVVVGPSGCGKSTLLNLFGLLDRATTGTLEIGGVPVQTLDNDAAARLRRADIGFLFQDAGLIERMSVLDNITLPLEYRAIPRDRRLQAARRAILELGLEARSAALVDTLSGGERQRVGLARILASRPRLIICDEPTASLDETHSGLVVNYLLEARSEGALVVCASHDPIVMERADIRLTMARGRLISADRLS